MITTPSTGICRYHSQTRKLEITTIKKKGRRKIKKTTVYDVLDLHPDKSVANPAYRLVKPDGECYDVHVDEWGSHCSCPHAGWRGAKSNVECKHVLACRAVGFLPRK